MMWMIFNRLFGWDYIHIRNTATNKIVRVKDSPNGYKIFQPYPDIVIVIHDPIPIEGKLIGGWVVTPLTETVTERENRNEHSCKTN